VQLGLQHLPRRQLHQILSHPDLASVQLQQLNLLPVLPAAQYQPNGRLLPRPALLFVQPSQVELRLALIGGIEAAQLQLDGNQAAQAAVIEKQIEIEVPLFDSRALLAGLLRIDSAHYPFKLPRSVSSSENRC
jgi:hypothetical protein